MLEQKGFINNLLTLTDITRELKAPFKDYRLEYRPLTNVEKFFAFTGETVIDAENPKREVGDVSDVVSRLNALSVSFRSVYISSL